MYYACAAGLGWRLDFKQGGIRMDYELVPQQILQPALFELGEATRGAVELFPAVWCAVESLLSPDCLTRQQGLAQLVELRAARFSPLVVAILASRLAEPDLDLRRQIASTLGDILTVDDAGQTAPEPVRQYLVFSLGQMRQRPIFSLLEVSLNDPQAQTAIARLLNACPYAGRHLADILSDRKMPLGVRREAARFIGLVGYLEAIPALERMEARLDARISGQQSMPFAPTGQPDETDLLPEIRAALLSLRAP